MLHKWSIDISVCNDSFCKRFADARDKHQLSGGCRIDVNFSVSSNVRILNAGTKCGSLCETDRFICHILRCNHMPYENDKEDRDYQKDK